MCEDHQALAVPARVPGVRGLYVCVWGDVAVCVEVLCGVCWSALSWCSWPGWAVVNGDTAIEIYSISWCQE